MSDALQGTQKPRYLRRRAITPARPPVKVLPVPTLQQFVLPVITAAVQAAQPVEVIQDPNVPNLHNVQGDVYFMFPKRWERFLLFKITDATKFRNALQEYAPMITSSDQTYNDIGHIDHYTGNDRSDIISTGIAFARAGMHKLDITQELKDPHFDGGSQWYEREALGDQSWRDYDPIFSGPEKTHGVILVTSKERGTCGERMDEIKAMFEREGSIDVVKILEGHVREGEREHFGWKDGISQPALESICEPKPGQRLVKPGVIIMGYPGDPLCGARPAFTKDGSFMVFRKLEQNPMYLDHYTELNWKSIPAAPDPDQQVSLNEEQRKALFGARLFGRFKSGVPLALCPYIEDTRFLDPGLINKFDFTEKLPRYGCPLSAHVRKTEPRNLEPIVSKEFLDSSVIIRAGIPYGDNPTSGERESFNQLPEDEKYAYRNDRGLFFVSYQSSIHNGFYRQTTGFGNNDWFPLTGLVPEKIGQDPIIGGPQPVQKTTGLAQVTNEGEITLNVINEQDVRYQVSGVATKVDTSAAAFEQKYFVTSRGGEWYFVPSISTVKEWAKPKAN